VHERGIEALVFDVFGTVVDWRRGVVETVRTLAGASGGDWGAFADDWRREGYLRPIGEIVAGSRPFAPVESLLSEPLDGLLRRHGIELAAAGRPRLMAAWRRLEPWPDVAAGLDRLRRRFVVAPLSNASFAQLIEMAKRTGLGWDCIVSTELFGTYKPDPAAYLGAVRLLGLDPGQLMLVAAHPADLRGAAAVGLKTAYVPRPEEWGPGGRAPEPPELAPDVVAADFLALADALGV
jgi:2-haloacid dehalogenase